ncbi:putative transcription factor Nin-like family [Helianthus annuus]|nr:putative transcription factor Nin-like family [Helianthus annuus]
MVCTNTNIGLDELPEESLDQSNTTTNDEASLNLGSLSREILQQDSVETQIVHETNTQDQQDFSNNYPKNKNSVIINTEIICVDDATSKIHDVVTREKQAFTKRRRKRQQHFGKPIGEASMRLGVSRSTLKRVCRELKIPSWPMPHCNKKYAHFGISVVVLLLVRVKRWVCSSNHHGFSTMWWICGKHNAFVCESNPLAKITPKGETICRPPYYAQLTSESIHTTPFSKASHAHLSVTPKKKRVVNVSDTRMVTVKASFKDDIIKFDFPLSSGVSELKNQVAQRIKLKSTRLRLKYRDEDDDLILISCDADIRNLMPLSASSVCKKTIRLIVQLTED